MEILEKLLAALTVAVGLGFVIFIHELGHFLVAKWAGVKVEKFAIGFGPVLLAWRQGIGLRFGATPPPKESGPEDDRPAIGETEYSLRAIPLGGFVKMLGEEPGEDSARTNDPRAYHNKPVPRRMAIISAGVTMNLLTGIAFFSVIYLKGTTIIPPIIGRVAAGMPAYRAGLRPGDRIVAIDGHEGIDYKDLQNATIFSSAGQPLVLDVIHHGAAEPTRIEIEPRVGEKDIAPSIGAASVSDLVLADHQPFADPPGMTGVPKDAQGGGLRGHGRLLAAGPAGGKLEPLADIFDYRRIASAHRAGPLDLLVADPAPKGHEHPRRTVTVPPNHYVDFGFRLAPGPVAAVRVGSPADVAGIRAGDLIIKVAGSERFDPMRLPELAYDHRGRSLAIEVRRPSTGRTLNLTVEPDDSPPLIEPPPIPRDLPLDVPGLGLALTITTRIAAVEPGTPAAKAGLKPGDQIRTMVLTNPPTEKGEEPETETFVFDDSSEDSKVASWGSAFWALQFLPQHAVTLTLVKSAAPIVLTPEPVADWFNPTRGLLFEALEVPLPPRDVATALRLGWRDTKESATSIFAMIRSLVQHRLGRYAFGGPIRIIHIGYGQARMGLDAFLRFLAMLSINLAVINFFPIPPLDGGQMVFLTAEGARGRPLPENVQVAVTLAGVVFVLGLVLFVSFNDVMSYFL